VRLPYLELILYFRDIVNGAYGVGDELGLFVLPVQPADDDKRSAGREQLRGLWNIAEVLYPYLFKGLFQDFLIISWIWKTGQVKTG